MMSCPLRSGALFSIFIVALQTKQLGRSIKEFFRRSGHVPQIRMIREASLPGMTAGLRLRLSLVYSAAVDRLLREFDRVSIRHRIHRIQVRLLGRRNGRL
jgi:hypothetical protein